MNNTATTDSGTAQGSVQSHVRTALRLEALAVLLGSLWAFHLWGQSLGWTGFALLFLLPDVALVAYFAGPRWGAVVYNSTHSYIGPALLLASSVATQGLGLAVGLVWVAHIAMDRSLGFGLKYAAGFDATHLGPLKWRGLRLGRLAQDQAPAP
jgi:Domain of unknown function (DUF4260)